MTNRQECCDTSILGSGSVTESLCEHTHSFLGLLLIARAGPAGMTFVLVHIKPSAICSAIVSVGCPTPSTYDVIATVKKNISF